MAHFSVVLNTYNRQAVVPRAIDSVLAQTYPDFELVVVDDGSVDATRDVVCAYEDPRLRYVHRANGGLAEARNTGLTASTGEFVAFMDDDDLVRPCWLARLAGATSEGTAVVSCGAEIRSPGAASSTRLPGPLGGAFDDQIGLFIPGTFCVRRDVLGAVGGFTEGLRCSEQTELALRTVPYCVEHGLRITSVAEALVITNREREERRPLRRADFLHYGALKVLERHDQRLRRSPDLYANFKAIAAVHGARLGKYREARSLLLDAIRVRPSAPKHYGRLVVASFPPLARRVWGTWSPADQAATAPRTQRRRWRSVVRRLPGAKQMASRRQQPHWPVRRPLPATPRCQPGWSSGPPDFVGIGAQRAGTSWWYSLICRHPAVHVNPSVPKELHFFDRYFDQEWADGAAERYHAYFPRPAGLLAGEWTPEYMVWPWCVPLLRASGVEKLIVCLRDPVERYDAGLSFSVRRGAPRVPTIAGDAFHRGLYHLQLSRVLDHFDRSQLLVLQYESCVAEPAVQLRRTYEFLGVDPQVVPEGLEDLVKAVHARPDLDPGLRQALTSAYRTDVEELAETFPEIEMKNWPNFAPGALAPSD